MNGFQNNLVEATTDFRVRFGVGVVATPLESYRDRENLLPRIEVCLGPGQLSLDPLLLLGDPVLISFE